MQMEVTFSRSMGRMMRKICEVPVQPSSELASSTSAGMDLSPACQSDI